MPDGATVQEAHATAVARKAPTLHGERAARANISAARRSLATAFLLGLLKLGAAMLTGSLAIVASLVDSMMDMLASSVNYFAVRLAGQPADDDHAYGHGKAEGLAGLAQALVVGFAGIFLLLEGLRRLWHGVGIEHTQIGIGVMVVSSLASVWITWRLKATARKTGSVALAADAVHYQSDVWTNGGVLVALLVIQITGWQWIDGGIATVVSLVVLGTAIHVLRRSADELMDRGLPQEEVDHLIAHVCREVPEIRGLHDVRTRRAGPTLFVDCHVQLDRDLSFVQAHRLSERVRIVIEHARHGALVNIHADPDPLMPTDLDDDHPPEPDP